MSVRMKRVGKRIRALFGVADGVQPAKPGQVCGVEVDPTRHTMFYKAKSGKYFCSARAHVVETGKPMCHEHMKKAHARKRT